MKNLFTSAGKIWKMSCSLFIVTMLSSCDEENINPITAIESITTMQSMSHDGIRCRTMGFDYGSYQKGLITTFNTPEGPVAITGRKRNLDGTYAKENHAALFDTQAPTGDDTDLYTTNWGLALIINESLINVWDDPNDNQWGGELILDFSAIGPVTMESLRALDIDSYENNSWVFLYNHIGREVHRVSLKSLGNNIKQTVDLGNTEGVMKMKIVFDGLNESGHLAGSGAIDNITFHPIEGCTRTLGYWKTHANSKLKKYDTTWKWYLGVPFFKSGMTYLDVLNKSSSSGDAYIILAHQYIAAELNGHTAHMPTYVNTAFENATAYFNGNTTPSRAQIISWSEILDTYNNGKSMGGPVHCD